MKLFIVVLHSLLQCLLLVCSLKSMSLPSFGCCVSELHDHLCPYIVMYGLRLFIVVLQQTTLFTELFTYFVRCCYHFIKFCFTKFRCSTLSGLR